MARIATRMHGPAQLSGAAATKYTVPANRKAIVRHIHVFNPSASSVTLTMSIGADAAPLRLFDAIPIPAGTPLDHFCYYTLEEAEIIQAFAGTPNVLVLVIDGDESVLS